jgi:DNA-binding SARP family transcriptional activator
MMYRIKLLGSLAIEVDGRSSRIVHSAKGMALLAYLIYTNDVQSREKVADLLWEASSTKQSLMRLRELLARVRKWLPELQTTRQTVSFQATDDCFVDLWVLRQGLATADTSQLDDLLQLYEGDFLADFHLVEGSYFNEWLVVAREQLRVQVLAAYERLCQFYAESEAWGQGVAAARRWVALTPFREEAHRWLMQMLAQNGQITAAWQAYDACCQILEGELGVEPEAETVALAEQLSEWGGRTAVLLATTPPEHLKAEVLSEPGQLPTNAILPYQRNQDFVGRTGELLHLAHWLAYELKIFMWA